MPENKKTIMYVAVAVVLLLLAFVNCFSIFYGLTAADPAAVRMFFISGTDTLDHHYRPQI